MHIFRVSPSQVCVVSAFLMATQTSCEDISFESVVIILRSYLCAHRDPCLFNSTFWFDWMNLDSTEPFSASCVFA